MVTWVRLEGPEKTNLPNIFAAGEEKRMLPSAVTDIEAFVPAKDLEGSKAF